MSHMSHRLIWDMCALKNMYSECSVMHTRVRNICSTLLLSARTTVLQRFDLFENDKFSWVSRVRRYARIGHHETTRRDVKHHTFEITGHVTVERIHD